MACFFQVNSHVAAPPHYIVTGIPYPANPAAYPPRPAPINRPAEPPTITPTPCEIAPKQTALDPNVLNNLAIALQLLIVSNLLNYPKENSEIISNLARAIEKLPVAPHYLQETLKHEPKYILEAAKFEPKYEIEPYYTGEPVPLSNSKYIGSYEPNVFRAYDSNARRSSRSHGALMSPYEAINSSPSFGESFPSVYGSPSKSLYVVDKDLFGASDLY